MEPSPAIIQWAVIINYLGVSRQILLFDTIKLDTIKSLAYIFVWGSQKEVSWSSMTFPQAEGCLGLSDFKMMQIASTIDCVARFWNGEGI